MNKHEFFWRALKNKLLNKSEESFCVLDFMNMMEQSISNDDKELFIDHYSHVTQDRIIFNLRCLITEIKKFLHVME